MVLFRASIDIEKHYTKKNGKGSGFNARTGKSWVFRKPQAVKAENDLAQRLKEIARRQLNGTTITGDIWVTFTFYFSDYFTAKMTRSKKLPDLDNLYALPQDALQKAGVIDDDCNICSHDGSRRKPGERNYIEIIIQDFVK